MGQELSVSDLAKLSGLSDRQVRRALRKDTHVHGRQVDGEWRVPRDEARRWLSVRGCDTALPDDTASGRFVVSSPELWEWLQSDRGELGGPIPLVKELPTLCEFLASNAPDEKLGGFWGGIGLYAKHVLNDLAHTPKQEQSSRVPAMFKLPSQ